MHFHRLPFVKDLPRTGRIALALACASLVPLSPSARAEGSPAPSDAELAALAESKRLPEAVEDYLAYLLDLDERYRNTEATAADALLRQEGETVALLYCRANGIDGACAPSTSGGATRLVAVDPRTQRRWWRWIDDHTTHIGVIPETPSCPAPYAYVEIFMDDENTNNMNSRYGWLGATVSTHDTRWRFCKLDIAATNQFKAMDAQAPYFTGAYAVQSFGMACPINARRVIRYQDNQDWNNTNATLGSTFPNVITSAGSWMVTCHYDVSIPLVVPMTDFPALSLHYGVYANPTGVTLLGGFRHPVGKVYQDDEDIFNMDFWLFQASLGPNGTMSGSNNTDRRLMKAY